MPVSLGATLTFSSYKLQQQQTKRRSRKNLNNSNLKSANSFNNNVCAGNHLSVQTVIRKKSRDSHHHQQPQHLQNSSGVSTCGDENNVIIGHATTSGTNEDDEFQLQLVHDYEIEIGNEVELESIMQDQEDVIIEGTCHPNPIVIKTKAGDLDLSGATVTLVTNESTHQQQMHQTTVSGTESSNLGGGNNEFNHGTTQDGSRPHSSPQHHHGYTNNITIPVLESLPCSVIGESEPNGSGTTRISLAQDQLHSPCGSSHQTTSRLTSTTNLSQTFPLTWEEGALAPILPIRCKSTDAELYRNKLGSGNRGKCIKSGNDWFTPIEFEALCGGWISKDWKHIIKFGGRTLQTLIDKGFLAPHSRWCACSNCEDNPTATVLVEHFIPRKRKSQNGDLEKSTKLKRLTLDSNTDDTDESSDIATPRTPLTADLNPLTQARMKINQMSLPACTEDAWKVLDDGVGKIVKAAATLKSLVQEMNKQTIQEAEELRSQISIQRIFDSNRIQTYAVEVLDPDNFKFVQTNTSSITKCDNCGREGSLKCSGCHAAHYCSSFCQNKDWPAHQAACQILVFKKHLSRTHAAV